MTTVFDEYRLKELWDVRLTPDEALEYMDDCRRKSQWDEENAHLYADAVLIATLRFFGQDELADRFFKVSKWYA